MLNNKDRNEFYLSCGKRMFDLALAILGLLVVSPIVFIITLLVRIQLGSPVLFKQIRPGLQEKPFTIFKFRTMTDARDKDGKLLPDAQRLTRLGACLRKTSMDELPELINVIKGEMSIVGPRPLFMEYLPYYTNREHLRHSIRPGITGLSQISGRNYLQWDERLEMDVMYLEKLSFFVDIKIIFRTLFQVLKAKDVAVLPGKVSVLFSEYRRKKKEDTF
jgi:lipopolysaccharide/colanic/teichoic acid biosynthesis glycosyltransferase